MDVLIADITEQIPVLPSSVLATPPSAQNQLIEIHNRDRTNYNIEYIVHYVLNPHRNHRFRYMSFSKKQIMIMQKKIFEKYAAMAVTDTGRVRNHNEDNVLIDEELGLLLVADGMGGHQAGEIASMEAINVIQQMIRLQQRTIKKQSGFFRFLGKSKSNPDEYQSALEKALHEANHHIHQLNIERNICDGSGMGTTVAGCWLIADNTMLVFHVGDSRVYRFRKQKLELLTKDHSVLQAWHDNGCEGEKPKSNVILRAIGPFPETQSEIQVKAIDEGDGFLICSDGLTDMLDDANIENILQGLTGNQLGGYSQKLLQSALNQGGKDNVSIIIFAQ